MAERQLKKPFMHFATALALLLTGIIIFNSLRLLLFGQAWIITAETPMKGVPQELFYNKELYPAAIIPLIAAGLIFSGLITRSLFIAWCGFVILIGFSLFFLFSSGAAFLSLAGLLFVLLLVITITERRQVKTL